MKAIDVDVVVFGGGIAGLWALARLRQAGFQAILLETKTIGGGQSIASQGIIHGGTKYALTGKLTGAAQAIGAMPGIWRDCLNGQGEVDLSSATVLAENQLMWSTGSIASGMAGFFAGKVMQSRMQVLDRSDYPELFSDPKFKGNVYSLAEPVLDARSVLQALFEPLKAYCFTYDVEQLVWQSDTSFTLDKLVIHAQQVVLMAGAGNASLLSSMGRKEPEMQLRPLQMLMLKGGLPELYAHCLGASANPRLTITSGVDADGEVIWYLGGQVAEQGVGLSVQDQIAAGEKELNEVMPWVDFSAAQWATLTIDRAEPCMPNGKRPDDCFIHSDKNVHTCWPTKLAFAPRLAGLLMETMKAVKPSKLTDMDVALNQPRLADFPWDEEGIWN